MHPHNRMLPTIVNQTLPCFTSSLNSSSVLLSITGKAKAIPLCTTFICLGFILFSKLKAKYWGNSFSSSNFLPISPAKYSYFGWKLFSMLKVSSAGHLSTMLLTSSLESPKVSKNLSLGMRVFSTLETSKTESW